jgi:NADPH:quinone reductase-like Zn-dependent oxidoreductase
MGGATLKEGVDISTILKKRVRIEGSTLRSRDVEYQGKLRDELEKYVERFEDGGLKVYVEKVMPWTEVVKAHELLEANTTKGKIICTVDW